MLAAAQSAAVLGIDALDVIVEVHVANGLPQWTMVGMKPPGVHGAARGHTDPRDFERQSVIYMSLEERHDPDLKAQLSPECGGWLTFTVIEMLAPDITKRKDYTRNSRSYAELSRGQSGLMLIPRLQTWAVCLPLQRRTKKTLLHACIARIKIDTATNEIRVAHDRQRRAPHAESVDQSVCNTSKRA